MCMHPEKCNGSPRNKNSFSFAPSISQVSLGFEDVARTTYIVFTYQLVLFTHAFSQTCDCFGSGESLFSVTLEL